MSMAHYVYVFLDTILNITLGTLLAFNVIIRCVKKNKDLIPAEPKDSV